jgi:uncharacterized repeat protein (TIGR01451 family)
VGIVYAFSIGNVDGVWGTIDTYESDGTILDVVGVIGSDPGDYWNGGGDLRTRARTLVRKSTVCGGDSNGDSALTEWTGYANGTYTYLGAHTINVSCSPTDLFISEYVHYERDGTDGRLIEIYNGTGGGLNMIDYSIHIYNGGSTTPSTIIPLDSYLLQSGSTFVISRLNETGVTEQQIDDGLDFSGDDAVALVKGYMPEVRDDAECSRWASGGITSSMLSDTWWNQTNWTGANPGIFNSDENLVLYGRETYDTGSGWAQIECEDTSLDGQSGFGFDGNNGPITPTAKTPFYLGAFTHYNQPVFAWTFGDSTDRNAFESVYLTVTVPVTCNDGGTTSQFSFDAHFFLEETSNTLNECEYGVSTDEPCPDRVDVAQPSSLAATFACPDGDYTVNILGFTTQGLGGDSCDESFNPASVSTMFITQEFSTNQACLWGEIDAPTADVAVAKTCREFDNQVTGDEFYRITVTNAGPGSSRQVEIVDTLPAGADYDTSRSWTSTLFFTGGSNPQGTCTVEGKTITCQLLTPLPDYVTDAAAKWEIDIPVTLPGGDKINTVIVDSGTTDPNLSNNTATATCDSTFACLISLGATASEEGILISWETSSEENNLGFNLYRAEDVEGLKEKLNESMIPSKNPDSTTGALYSFLDPDVTAGVEYFYWLEDVDTSFVTNLYGPLSIKVKE